MSFPALPSISKTFMGLGALSGLLIFLLLTDENPVLFESLESKGKNDSIVYNKVYLSTESGKDIWLMEQSHGDLNAKKSDWDKVAIVVEKGEKKRARFFQLQQGPEPISMNLRPVNFKAPCAACHSNGPRAIRPNFESPMAQVSYWDRARLFLWNLRIKSYGPMDSEAVGSQKPFHLDAHSARLQVKACTRCHNAKGRFARNKLTREHFMAIRFMLQQGLMPPPGFGFSSEERKAVERFVGL